MELIGTVEILDEPVEVVVQWHLRDGTVLNKADEIQRENLLAVHVNDIPTMQIGCSASHLAELVCGRLFTEGLVSGIDEIQAVSVCENSMRADVYLADREADLSRKMARMVPTCCTNNVTLHDYFATDEPLKPVQPIPWEDEWVFRMTDAFAIDDTLHKRTRGTHSAYLANSSGLLYVREDIGRHNAFDKAIGAALMEGVDLTQCLLFTSGRIPTDMAVKAIRARLPILASKAVATDKTIELAREFDLTLICNAAPDRFDVVCQPSTPFSK